MVPKIVGIIFYFILITIVNLSKGLHLKETKNVAEAVMMYNEFDVKPRSTHHVCGSVDNKTTRLFGDVVCKFSLQKLGLPASEMINNSCVNVRLDAKTYRRGLERKGDYYIRRAYKCIYGASESESIFIMNAPKQFYYIFKFKEILKKKEVVEIVGVFNIHIKLEDFTPFELTATTDSRIADNIFGEHGSIGRRSKVHVCKMMKNTRKKRGVEICRSIIASQNREFLDDKRYISCARHRISRNVRKINSEISRIGVVYCIKCHYRQEGTPVPILVINSKLEDHFYVAELNRNGEWKITSCANVKG